MNLVEPRWLSLSSSGNKTTAISCVKTIGIGSSAVNRSVVAATQIFPTMGKKLLPAQRHYLASYLSPPNQHLQRLLFSY